MRLFLSIVSHNNASEILGNELLFGLTRLDFVEIVLLDNVGQSELQSGCLEAGISYLRNEHVQGFGANNNIVFRYCTDELGMQPEDGFLLLNPDVLIEPAQLRELRERAISEDLSFATGALYLNEAMTVQDQSLRPLPNILDIAASFLFGKSKKFYDFDRLTDLQEIDCCSGALMFFKAQHYIDLNGFDEKYYLYYEDFEVCRRSKKMGIPLRFLGDFRAVHRRKRHSRQIFSWYFWQHVKSAIRFCITR